MLFDLRGRGRRRTVQVIYLSLALLMGGGLVFFGIGGATSGGLLDAFKEDAQRQGSDVYIKRAERAEAAARATPNKPSLWAEAARARYLVAGQGENFDQTRGVFTDKGKAELARVERDWDLYLTKVKKPDPNVASLMIQAFGPAGLNKLDKAVRALEIVVERKPTPQLYVQLAALAYQAGQTRKGDLAGKKALSLAPKDDREQLKGQLEGAKQASTQAQLQTSTTP
jgi:hypothetical protein